MHHVHACMHHSPARSPRASVPCVCVCVRVYACMFCYVPTISHFFSLTHASLTSPLSTSIGAVPSLHSTPTNMTTSRRMSSSTACAQSIEQLFRFLGFVTGSCFAWADLLHVGTSPSPAGCHHLLRLCVCICMYTRRRACGRQGLEYQMNAV